MRYAIFSDIHANQQAWQATLEDIRANDCEVLVCLGDAVGYGPNPLEVLTSIREHSHAFVLGNHDAAACERLDFSYFNDNARAGILHTRSLLDQESLDFLANVPYATEAGDILFVHAEVAQPDRFDYIESAEKACEDFAATRHRCTFMGHTHHPTVFVEADGLVDQLADEDFEMSPGHRYIINVGSVGEPRNPEDIRARYVIYDEETQSIYFRRIEFDAEAYRADLQASGSSAFPYFLQILDHQTGVGGFVRAMRTPVATSGEGIRIAKMELPTVSSVSEVSREVTKKSAVATVAILVLIAASVGAGFFGKWYFDEERLDFAADPLGITTAPAPLVELGDQSEAEELFGYWPLDAETKGYAGIAPFLGFGIGKPGRAEGKFGNAIHLDADSGLVFGKARTFAMRDEPMTVSFWVQLTDPSESEVRLVGNGARSKTEPGWLITLHRGALYFRLGSGVNRAQLGGVRPELMNGEWHHIAVVFDPSSGQMRAFFNGELIGELDVSSLGTEFPAAHRLVIGKKGAGEALAGLGGNVDEFAIWRRAFTGEEVASLFNRAVALSSTFSER